MYGMKYDRIEVRLDEEHVRKLSELRATYDASSSEVVRHAIDVAYEEEQLKKRLEALERIKAFEGGEEMPDPEELRRQIIAGYDYDLPDPD